MKELLNPVEQGSTKGRLWAADFRRSASLEYQTSRRVETGKI
jgi:hypothetical protein